MAPFFSCLVLALAAVVSAAPLPPSGANRLAIRDSSLETRALPPIVVANMQKRDSHPVKRGDGSRRCKAPPYSADSAVAPSASAPAPAPVQSSAPPANTPTPTPTPAESTPAYQAPSAQATSSAAPPPAESSPSPAYQAPQPSNTPTPPPSSGSGSGSGSGASSGPFSGDGTFYSTGLGACGITNTDTDMIAAVSHEFFDSFPGYDRVNPNKNPLCGKRANVNFGGKNIAVTITDRCEGCAFGALDFSPTAFSQLADFAVGRIHGLSWTLS